MKAFFNTKNFTNNCITYLKERFPKKTGFSSAQKPLCLGQQFYAVQSIADANSYNPLSTRKSHNQISVLTNYLKPGNFKRILCSNIVLCTFLKNTTKATAIQFLKRKVLPKAIGYSFVSIMGSGLGLNPVSTAISLMIAKTLFQNIPISKDAYLKTKLYISNLKIRQIAFLNPQNCKFGSFPSPNLSTFINAPQNLSTRDLSKIIGLALFTMKLRYPDVFCEDLLPASDYSLDSSKAAWSLDEISNSTSVAAFEPDLQNLDSISQEAIPLEGNINLDLLAAERAIADPAFQKFSQDFFSRILKLLSWKIFKIFASVVLLQAITYEKSPKGKPLNTKQENPKPTKENSFEPLQKIPFSSSESSVPKIEKSESCCDRYIFQETIDLELQRYFENKFPPLDPNLGCTFYK